MVKIIFSDFDETMLNYHSDKNYFDEYQIDVLKKLHDYDIKFCIVTGRNNDFFYQFSNIIPYIDFIISSNGACIFDLKKNNFIYQKFIDDDNVTKLFNYVQSRGIDLFYNSLGKQFYNESFDKIINCEQVILSFHKNSLEDVCDDISSNSNIVCNNICRHDDRYTIDINDLSVSKGKAVKYLCDYLEIDVKDTICFGDSDNDASMFEVVGKSVSVANGTDKIKSLANNIILSSEENGIFKYIDDYILK